MIALRIIAMTLLVAGAALPAWAQRASPLSRIDRDLNALCRQMTGPLNAESAATRNRLASLWRRRVAAIADIPEPQRAAVLARSALAPDCYVVAKAAAERPIGKAKKAAKKKKAFKNGGPPAANGGGEASGLPSSDVFPLSVRRPRRGPASVPTLAPVDPVQPGSADAPPLQEFSPWPPPAPSGRQLLGVAQLGGDRPAANWGEVADRIRLLLAQGGFSSWGFYAAPGGFAVVTRIEQIDSETGVPLAGNERWAQEVKLASTSFLAGLLTTRRPRGVYRVIVFILTTDPSTGGEVTAPSRMLQLARRWGISGAADLPHALRRNPVTEDQRLFAMVYEFESTVGGDTVVNAPGRWQLREHLRNAGIELAP